MADYRIYLRGAGRARVAEVDDYSRLDLVLRFNDVGKWLLLVPERAAFSAHVGFSSGIVVVRDGVTLLSGPIRHIERRWNEEGAVIELGGPDDNVWLRDRLAAPVPAGPPYTAAADDVRTGVCSTVMREYVDNNAGPGANATRRVSGLTIGEDLAVGASVTGRARFTNLLELLQALAHASGDDVGFRVVQDGTDLEFRVYRPVDRTATVLFSPLLGTLRAFSYRVDAAEANYVVVGGSGEGTARTFAEKGDSASQVSYGRIEAFRDQRNTSASAELLQAADEELAAKKERTHLSITPIDTENQAFGTHYGLGDEVTVVIIDETEVVESVVSSAFLSPTQPTPRTTERRTVVQAAAATVQDKVREVFIALAPDKGEQITPVVGTPDTRHGGIQQVFDSQRRLARRMSLLERR